MKLVKRVFSATSAAVIGLSTLMTVGFTGVASAAGLTCTWTGATNDNFSAAGNWSNCSGGVPGTGDNLVFDASIITGSKVTGWEWVVNNDISNLQVGSITFSGENSNSYNYKLTGNSLSVSGGITSSGAAFSGGAIGLSVSLATDQTFTSINGSLTFSNTSVLDLNGHTLTLAGGSDGGCANFINFRGALGGSGSFISNFQNLVGIDNTNQNYSGTFQFNSGTTFANGSNALGNSTGGVTVASGAELVLGLASDTNFGQTFSIAGTGVSNGGVLRTQNQQSLPGCSGADATEDYTATFTGALNLDGDATFGSYHVNTNFTGAYNPNGHTLSVAPGSLGTLTLPGGQALSVPEETNTYSDSQPTQNLTVANKQTAIIDGTRQYVNVSSGGVVKGTGTIKSLNISQGGIVAPGHSPGKLTVLETLNLSEGSVYQAELQTKDAYDQLQVSDASRTTGQDVTLTNPTLTVSLYSGFKMTAGDTFTIINNLQPASQKVNGTFLNLPEGATFKVGDGVFKISYVGGDGNDVVLTVVTAPTTPDTGFAFIGSNPIATLSAAVVAAGAILIVARKMRPSPVRVRATTRRRK